MERRGFFQQLVVLWFGARLVEETDVVNEITATPTICVDHMCTNYGQAHPGMCWRASRFSSQYMHDPSANMTYGIGPVGITDAATIYIK